MARPRLRLDAQRLDGEATRTCGKHRHALQHDRLIRQPVDDFALRHRSQIDVELLPPEAGCIPRSRQPALSQLHAVSEVELVFNDHLLVNERFTFFRQRADKDVFGAECVFTGKPVGALRLIRNSDSDRLCFMGRSRDAHIDRLDQSLAGVDRLKDPGIAKDARDLTVDDPHFTRRGWPALLRRETTS